MRLPRVVLVCLVFLAGAAWADEKAPAAGPKPESLKDRSSYAFGVNLVAVARQNGIELNEEYFVRGIRDALADKLVMTTEEIQTALKEQEQELDKRRKADASAQGVKNKMEGDAFFAENTKREGIVTLPSGLQYKVMKEGAGPMPKETDRVKVHYRGKLLGGPEFDSSYERGEPSIVPVNGVIAGWKEALRLMPVGSQWKIWIPPQLAYGNEGKGGIGPNATIVFEVELLGIENDGSTGGSG
jgi:FKBP-type peptidyl-prolyl cis-trans isomerase FklB